VTQKSKTFPADSPSIDHSQGRIPLSTTCTVQGHFHRATPFRDPQWTPLPYAKLLLVFPRSLEYNSIPLLPFRYKLNIFHSQFHVVGYIIQAFHRGKKICFVFRYVQRCVLPQKVPNTMWCPYEEKTYIARPVTLMV
jgi:hypothetical protein